MCPPPTVIFVTNSMLLWWTLDSVPLLLVIKTKIVKEVLQWSGECKCKVTSIKPNWQASWTCSFVRRRTDLMKTVNMHWLLISLSVITIADAFLLKRWRLGTRSTIRFMTQYTKKTDFTREQSLHSPKVPQKTKFIQECLPTYLWLCTSLHGCN